MKPKNLKDIEPCGTCQVEHSDPKNWCINSEIERLIKDRIKELEKEMNDLFMDGNIITMGETRLFRFLKAHAVIKELKRLLGDG